MTFFARNNMLIKILSEIYFISSNVNYIKDFDSKYAPLLYGEKGVFLV